MEQMKGNIAPMKTMPRPILKGMRVAIEALLAVIRRWEDKHADPRDYRMTALNASLWTASQSMREILDGDFNPMRRAHVPAYTPEEAASLEVYCENVLGRESIPFRIVD